MASQTLKLPLQDNGGRAIEQAALQRLRKRTSALKTVGCRFRRGVLFLRGTVLSYYHKQLAQQCVRGVPGVDRIINLTRVDEST